MEQVNKALEVIAEELVADQSDLFNTSKNGGGMNEQSFVLGSEGCLEIPQEQLEKLEERAAVFSAGLVESGARKRSSVLKEQFSQYVCQLMSGKQMSYHHADRYLRIAFLSLGYVPGNKMNEVLQWANSDEGAIPLEEAVVLADHGFSPEETQIIFDKSYFKKLRLSLKSEAERFINAMRRGVVRVKARAEAGDKYAGYQAKRFMNQACRDFGVNAEVMRADSSVVAFINKEVKKSYQGIVALGGLKNLDRGFMTMGENLQRWGRFARFEELFDASLDAIRSKTGWSPVEILTRFDFSTEIDRAQPIERQRRKAFALQRKELARNNKKEKKEPTLSEESFSFLSESKRLLGLAKYLAKKGDKSGSSKTRRSAASMKAMALAPKKGDEVYAALQKATSSFEEVVFQESVSWEPADGINPKVLPLDKGVMEVRVPFRTATSLLTAVFYAAIEDLWEVNGVALATVDTLPEYLVDAMRA